jgi:hypothetical protein
MRSVSVRLGVCIAMATLALSGCAGSQKSAMRSRGPVCDDAIGRAVASGTADARSFAQGALKYQIQELRGYLSQSGVRNIQVQSQRVDCQPYALSFGGSGLKLCVASARVCGE